MPGSSELALLGKGLLARPGASFLPFFLVPPPPLSLTPTVKLL